MNPDRALDFIDFVTERHLIWERRQAGEPGPWTTNPILASKKFTNAFRVLDPGSQFVVTDLVEEGLPEYELLARCVLYRHTNLPSAWRAFAAETGDYPVLDTLGILRDFWHDYKASGGRVFSGAYMIYPQSSTPGTDKIDSVIDLVRRLWTETQTFSTLLLARDQASRFAALRANRGIADFMAMQILTDYGYSTAFREDEFVVPGPGARKGAAALEMAPQDAIEWGYQVLRGPGIEVQGHRLSRMDIQNCLCEFSKYVRYQSKPSPQKPYVPAHPGVQLAPVLPAGWLDQ